MSASFIPAAIWTMILLAGSSLIGVALQRFGLRDRNRTTTLLTAPITGFSLVIVGGFWFAKLGLPLRTWGVGWIAVLTISAVLYLFFHERDWLKGLFKRWRGSQASFAIPLLIALLLFGYPVALFGFNYIAFGNGDWTFYLLNAQALFERGYGFPENLSPSALDTDKTVQATLMLWTSGRQGTEILIASVMSLSGLPATAVYVILAIIAQVCIVCSAMAMIWENSFSRFTTVVVGLAAALAPMLTYGYILQLLPQNLGIAFLAVNASNILTLSDVPRRRLPTAILMISIGVAAHFLTYPELTPFLVFAIAFNFLIRIFAPNRRVLPEFALRVVATGCIALLIVAPSVAYGVRWLTNAATKLAPVTSHGQGLHGVLYPSMLHVIVLAEYWGIHTIGEAYPAGLQALITLIFSVLLSGFAIIAMARSASRGHVAGLVAIPMFVFALRFFALEDDFAAFKMTMYSQIFAWTSLIEGMKVTSRHRRLPFSIRQGIALALVIISAITSQHYISRSLGYSGSPGFVEFRNGSANGMVSRLAGIASSQRAGATVVDDTVSVTAAELADVYFRGRRLVFMNQDDYGAFLPGHQMLSPPERLASSLAQPAARYASLERRLRFRMPSGGRANEINSSSALTEALERHSSALVHDESDSFIINHPGNAPNLEYPTIYGSLAPKDFLVPLTSKLGSTLFAGGSAESRTLYFPERDFISDLSFLQGLSRYLVLEMPQPQAGRMMRLLFSETATPFGAGQDRLSKVRVDGSTGAILAFTGHGSGRIISAPVRFYKIDGLNLLQLDLGSDAELHERQSLGPLGLLNANVINDERYLTVFGREISIMSDEEYHKILRPSLVASFPRDLLNRSLEYTGVFEDGWSSEDASFRLRPAKPGESIRIRGRIPLTSDNANTPYRVSVSIDGSTQVFDRNVGAFDVSLVAPNGGYALDVRIAVSPPITLPQPDGRTVGAQLESVGYDNDIASAAGSPVDGWNFNFGDGWFPKETFAGSTFRWLTSGAKIEISAPNNVSPHLVGEAEAGSDLHSFDADVAVMSGSATLAKAHLHGRALFDIELPKASGLQRYRIVIVGARGLPASAADPRILDLRVFKIRLQ